MLRNVSVVAIALSVAILFGCIGSPSSRTAKAQTKAAVPAQVDKPLVDPVSPLPEPPQPSPADLPAVPAAPAPAEAESPTDAKPTELGRCNCNCEVKVLDLQRQINDLKSEMIELKKQITQMHAKPPAPVPAGWKIKSITFHTQDGCIWCTRWLNANKTKVDAEGVEFIEKKPGQAGFDGSRGTPAFDVIYCDQSRNVCSMPVRFSNVSYEIMKAYQPKDR